jgi:hypothetical protein
MYKLASKDYQTAKKILREQKFNQWIKCPEIYECFNLKGEIIDEERILK